MKLRSSLVALGAGSAAAVLILLTPAVVVISERGVRAERQQDAIARAQGVADFASAGADTRSQLAPFVDRVNGRGTEVPITVRLADGTILGEPRTDCSTTASVARIDERDRARGSGELNPTSPALVTDVADGQLVRISTPAADGEVTVCALVADGRVWTAVAQRLGLLAGAGLVILAAVAVLALLIARRLAGHVVSAAAVADRLGQGDLTARVSIEGPQEVQRVGTALNRLAVRIDDLLALERETVADLSHRLRTPLMTVRLDVEALPPSSSRDELSDHLALLERTLTAVIQAARRGDREGAVPRCDLAAVVVARYEHWAPLIEDQDRQTHLDSDVASPRMSRCAARDLGAALDALLENAVAHTVEGTDVGVVVRALPEGWTEIGVRDRGPGVPLPALQRGRSDRGSSGLGLDIARACAESTGGGLTLAREDGWAIVRMTLGPADI